MSETLLCKQVNQMDMVDYLKTLGHDPVKQRGNQYWYQSPLRNERTASFKVDRRLNWWFDHGTGKGGTLVDFGIAYFKCSVKDFLQRMDNNKNKAVTVQPAVHTNKPERQSASADSQLKITSTGPVTNGGLLQYLKERHIPPSIAARYCQQISFQIRGKEIRAIGFRNESGGYELRNRYFKGSTAPKAPVIVRARDSANGSGEDTKDRAASLIVFEGFFDFLSYQALRAPAAANKPAFSKTDLPPKLSDCLVLNSTAFFEKWRPAMEQYQQIHLMLDRDATGTSLTTRALQWSDKYKDNSQYYQGSKDLNEWLVKTNGLQTKQELSVTRGYDKGLGL